VSHGFGVTFAGGNGDDVAGAEGGAWVVDEEVGFEVEFLGRRLV
jgi:hypothetical protein